MKIFILLLLTLTNLYAQDILESTENKKLLVIEPIRSPLINKEQKSYINRIAINISAKQKLYNIMISDVKRKSKITKSIYHLEWVITKQRTSYRLQVRIFDRNRKVILKRVIKNNIKQEDLRIIAEDALLLLFGFPVKNEKIKPKSNIVREENLAKKEETRRNKKRKLDFRKRILGMKRGIKNKFKEIEKKPKEIDEDESKDKNRPKDPEKDQLNNGIIKLRDKDVYQKRKKKAFNGKFIFTNWYSAGFLQSNYLIKDRAGAVEEVLFRTEASYLKLQIHTEVWHSKFDYLGLFSRFGILMAQKSEEFSPPLGVEFDLGLLASFFSDESLYLRLGARKDIQSFAVLPVLGEGIETASVNVTWVLFSAHYLFHQRKYYTKFEYAKQIDSTFEQGNFKDGSLEIQKLKLFFGFSSSFLLRGSYFEFAYQPTYFEAQGSRNLEGEDTSYFLNFNFSL